MTKLLEMAVEMVKTRLASTPNSKVSNEEMMAQIKELYAQLLELSKGEEEAGNRAGAANMLGGEVLAEPSIPPKKAFKKDKVICLRQGNEDVVSSSESCSRDVPQRIQAKIWH